MIQPFQTGNKLSHSYIYSQLIFQFAQYKTDCDLCIRFYPSDFVKTVNLPRDVDAYRSIYISKTMDLMDRDVQNPLEGRQFLRCDIDQVRSRCSFISICRELIKSFGVGTLSLLHKAPVLPIFRFLYCDFDLLSKLNCFQTTISNSNSIHFIYWIYGGFYYCTLM